MHLVHNNVIAPSPLFLREWAIDTQSEERGDETGVPRMMSDAATSAPPVERE